MSKNVDTGLHAHTSGAAADLAAKHQAEHDLQLYGGWFCPFVQRAWITLCEKQIPHQYIEINPYKKAPEFLALNPRGLVPTLAVPVPVPVSVSGSGSDPIPTGTDSEQEQGTKQKPLYESTVICAYLDEVYNDTTKHGPSLLPTDAYERARSRIWIDHIATRIIPSFYRFIQHQPDKTYSIEEARAEFWSHIKTFVEACDSRGPFFAGQQFGMVDIMLAPWAARLFLIDHYKPGGLQIPRVTNDDQEKGKEIWTDRWRVWFDAVMARQSVLDTSSSREKYIEAYQRYAEDTTGSQVGQATRGGSTLR